MRPHFKKQVIYKSHRQEDQGGLTLAAGKNGSHYMKNILKQKGCTSSSSVPTQQVWGPEIKPQFHQNNNKRLKRHKVEPYENI
jgi:hypothetical protein